MNYEGQGLDPFNSGNTHQNKKGPTDGLALTSIITGIASILCCGLGGFIGILAIIFGIIAVVRDQGGRNLGIIGIVLGIIGMVFFALIVFAGLTEAIDPNSLSTFYY